MRGQTGATRWARRMHICAAPVTTLRPLSGLADTSATPRPHGLAATTTPASAWDRGHRRVGHPHCPALVDGIGTDCAPRRRAQRRRRPAGPEAGIYVRTDGRPSA